MKTAMFCLMALLITVSAYTQDISSNQLPAAISQAFEKKFSNAINVEWEKKKNLHEVEFEINAVDYKALFNSSGTLVKYKKDLQQNDLPQAVVATISKDYDGYQIDDVDKLFIGSKSYYQVELDGKIMDKKIVISEDGKIQKNVDYMD